MNHNLNFTARQTLTVISVTNSQVTRVNKDKVTYQTSSTNLGGMVALSVGH